MCNFCKLVTQPDDKNIDTLNRIIKRTIDIQFKMTLVLFIIWKSLLPNLPNWVMLTLQFININFKLRLIDGK
jgi:hypothetical protein